jgi:transcription antitermination protein NusB
MTRRFARELALQALFSIDIGHHEPAAVLAETLTQRGIDDHRIFIRDLVLGTLEHADEADAVLSPLLEGWTIERLPTIDRLLLRMSVFEMRFRSETPPAVVMNEAIELAKKFSTEESGRFVNGVLSSVSKVA